MERTGITGVSIDELEQMTPEQFSRFLEIGRAINSPELAAARRRGRNHKYKVPAQPVKLTRAERQARHAFAMLDRRLTREGR